MSDSLTVGLSYRKNALSKTEGGVVVSIERGDGLVLDYPNIKYPQAYVRKVVANQIGIEVSELAELAFKPEYRDEIKKVVRRIWIEHELYWEQEDQSIPWLDANRNSSSRPQITKAQSQDALRVLIGEL